MAVAAISPVSTVFGERLRRARAMRGYSLRALSDALGGRVTHAALGKYEAGQMMPSSRVLLALAEVLSVRPDYFFETQQVELSGIEFRKKASLGKRKQDRVIEEAREFLERYLEIEGILNIKNPPLPQVALKARGAGGLAEQAEAAAEEIRREWKLGCEPLANVHELLEDRGVKVREIHADDDFCGLSGWAGKTPVIVLAENLNEDLPRKRLTELHELGHLVMKVPKSLTPKAEERLSYRFAGAMLFPKERFEEEFGSNRRGGLVSLEELLAMKGQWGMSLAAIMHRAWDLDLITEDRYKRFCIILRQRGWHVKEPGNWKGSEQSCRFRQLIHRAAAQELISRTKAAGLLGISLLEFDNQFGKVG